MFVCMSRVHTSPHQGVVNVDGYIHAVQQPADRIFLLPPLLSLSHTYFPSPTPICTLSTPPLPLTSPSVPHFHRLINKQLVSLFDGGCESKIKRRRCWRAERNVGSQNEGEVTGEREGKNQKGCFTESPVWVSGWNSLCSKTWRVNTTVCQ